FTTPAKVRGPGLGAPVLASTADFVGAGRRSSLAWYQGGADNPVFTMSGLGLNTNGSVSAGIGSQTQWTTVNVDTNGDGAAGTDVGPGSVNLLTGDYTISSTDADESGLSAARTASSREPTDGWLPQGERLTPNQQQVSTDTNGFGAGDGVATLAR